MSSGSTSKSSDKGFVHYFRYWVGFFERFFHNAVTQGKWTLEKGKWMHRKTMDLHHRHLGPPPQFTRITFAAFYGLIGLIVMKFLLIWALIKSV